MKEIVKAKAYTLYTNSGGWLGQVVITSDGMFSGVTDWGNLSYAWRSFGQGRDFREFLTTLSPDYFGGKLYAGLTYIAYGEKYEKSCLRFAEKILPPLQKILKKELEDNIPF